MSNIKPILDAAKVSLEREASNRFGAAIEDFAANTFGGLLGLPSSTEPANRNDGSWYATSYATALAGKSQFRPKLKFLFKVEFLFKQTPDVIAALQAAGVTDNRFTFMIKSVERPKFDFEYEDDLNYYNFRTRALKKIVHRDLSIVFTDDVGNNVFRFFQMIMATHSPIIRRSLQQQGANRNMATGLGGIGNGMQFTTNPIDSTASTDYAHRGVVNSPDGSIISKIRIRQIYVDPRENLDTAAKSVYFDFLNPKVISFDLDDLTHETSDVNSLTMNFHYDWMELGEEGSLVGTPGPDYKGENGGVNGAPADITPTGRSSGNAQGGNDPFSSILVGAASRAASTITADAIGKALNKVPAGFGQNVGAGIGGLIGTATRQLAGSFTSTLRNTFVRPTSPVLSDSSTFGPDRATTTPSSGALLPDGPAVDQGGQ